MPTHFIQRKTLVVVGVLTIAILGMLTLVPFARYAKANSKILDATTHRYLESRQLLDPIHVKCVSRY